MSFVYPYLRGDGVPVASPLFQGEGGGSIPTSPLQLRFEPCDMRTACDLNRYWHSRLPIIQPHVLEMTTRRACYWAVFEGGVFASAIWTDPVAANRLTGGGFCVELRRLAIGPLAPRNTASRMLAWMKRDLFRTFPDVVRLISYQDTQVHSGGIYRAAGWHIAATNDFKDWRDSGRAHRNAPQSSAVKARWELTLRESA